MIRCPAQSIIDRVKYVDLEIDMFNYTFTRKLSGPDFDEHVQHEHEFVSPMLRKLNARKTPGVACRIIFSELSTEGWSWDEAPFLLEALECRPNFRTVSMELECFFAQYSAQQCPMNWYAYNDTNRWCERFLRDDLKLRLEKTMGPGHIREKPHLHCDDFHPQPRLSENNSPETTLVEKKPSEDGSEKEVAIEEI